MLEPVLAGTPEVGDTYDDDLQYVRDLGLPQLDGCLDRLGLDHGVLVLFEGRDPAAAPVERTRFEQATSPTGRPVLVLRA